MVIFENGRLISENPFEISIFIEVECSLNRSLNQNLDQCLVWSDLFR